MRTYSHFILTAALSQQRGLSSGDRKALLLGSIAPDIPLTVLTAGYFIARKMSGLPAEREFQEIRCTDPAWVISYNFFHAPLILIPVMGFAYLWGFKHGRGWARLLFWFVVGCGFHSAVDMVTHYDDGPLLLFPLDWQTRIKSPVSYWDKRHSGRVFTILEHLTDILLVRSLPVVGHSVDAGKTHSLSAGRHR